MKKERSAKVERRKTGRVKVKRNRKRQKKRDDAKNEAREEEQFEEYRTHKD
jgi:hypothetical protein